MIIITTYGLIIMVIYDWQLVGDMIWLFQMANADMSSLNEFMG